MNKYIGIIILLLIGALAYTYSLWKESERKLDISISNNKAYLLLLEGSADKARLFQMTIDLLKYCNDSISKAMQEAIKESKVKGRNITNISYNLSIATRIDTIITVDTIFQPAVRVDTIVGDKWYHMDLKLSYPDTIVIKPLFVSEKIIIMSTKRETVDPPKKFFLLRWFQKKHTVVTVDVIENNPYIEQTQSRFIEIIK